jgi:hypothetical protein
MHAHTSLSVTGEREQTAPERRSAWTLTDEDRAAIRTAVAALPSLTDEQVDALCDIIIAARRRWQREDTARSQIP